jgi:uncharacterized membrane protein HdeD (DUF308 family)
MYKLNELVERAPMVWLLLGLLIITGGLYLGFDNSLSFVYMLVGAFCSVYGIILFIFLAFEKSRSKSARPLSPKFIRE